MESQNQEICDEHSEFYLYGKISLTGFAKMKLMLVLVYTNIPTLNDDGD